AITTPKAADVYTSPPPEIPDDAPTLAVSTQPEHLETGTGPDLEAEQLATPTWSSLPETSPAETPRLGVATSPATERARPPWVLLAIAAGLGLLLLVVAAVAVIKFFGGQPATVIVRTSPSV